MLVAGEGLNLFLAGDAGAIASFLAPLRDDARFAGLRVKYSTSRQVPFARLKVKVKPEIISFRRPGTTPEDARAPAVEPATLARWQVPGWVHDYEAWWDVDDARGELYDGVRQSLTIGSQKACS